MIRILIVDDQNLIREGIKVLLEKAVEIEIVGDASSGESALEKIAAIQPDVVLLDIDLPGIDGLTVADRIRLKFPKIKIIMLSSHDDKRYVAKATALGAKGYLLKDATSEQLEWSIKLVHQGYSAIKSDLLNCRPNREDSSGFDGSSQSQQKLRSRSAVSSSNFNSSATQQTVTRDSNPNDIELLLAKNQVRQKYLAVKQQRQRKYIFHSAYLSKIKKTITSFEFRLLVLIIMFSLGFLIFIALS